MDTTYTYVGSKSLNLDTSETVSVSGFYLHTFDIIYTIVFHEV